MFCKSKNVLKSPPIFTSVQRLETVQYSTPLTQHEASTKSFNAHRNLPVKPITNMAFYCCGVRMQDAGHARSVCGDDYAKLFMDAHGLHIFEIFKQEENCNASMLIRHRIIDDVLRKKLAEHPNLCIISIGSGFDSRPYRLTGGNWVELDEPSVIIYKNQRLPIMDCPNPLQRIPIDFCVDSLEEKLASIIPGGPIVVVMEGVFIYLDEPETKEILSVLHELFPGHELICDLVNREMVETYGQTLRDKIEAIGAHFKLAEKPESAFTSSDYRIKQKISIAENAAKLGLSTLPPFILQYFYSANIKGNAVYVFEEYELYDDLVI